MLQERGLQLESKRTCGVPLARVLARRIHSLAGKKGFGNARAVRNKVEEIICRQTQRLGNLRLADVPVSDADYRLLTRADSIGSPPDYSNSPLLLELDSLVGLANVKAEVRRLIDLQLRNHDREAAGDMPERISLHRVFYGNPGTGKTTVVQIYGALLKELGLLSKGDFVSCVPSDLTVRLLFCFSGWVDITVFSFGPSLDKRDDPPQADGNG